MTKPTVLFLFNHSLYALQPWLDDGRFNVVSVDYDDTDHSDHHAQSSFPGLTRINLDLSMTEPSAKTVLDHMLIALDLAPPSLVVSFAPCTDLAVSGAAHFAKKAIINPNFQIEALELARLANKWKVPYCVENPVSKLATLWRPPDYRFNPCDYAGYCPSGPHPEFPDIIPEQDRYNKKTCLWSGYGFTMPEVKHLPPIDHDNPGHVKLGGKSAKTKYIRSLTPRGFAKAIYVANHGRILNETTV